MLTVYVAGSRIFYDKRMSQEVMADALGDEFKGYVLRITGGNDVRARPLVALIAPADLSRTIHLTLRSSTISTTHPLHSLRLRPTIHEIRHSTVRRSKVSR